MYEQAQRHHMIKLNSRYVVNHFLFNQLSYSLILIFYLVFLNIYI
jgi:uncharacterized membrane protein